jgi:hypothetical protein
MGETFLLFYLVPNQHSSERMTPDLLFARKPGTGSTLSEFGFAQSVDALKVNADALKVNPNLHNVNLNSV